jgi:dCMP deaminase
MPLRPELPTLSRPTWDEYFLAIAIAVSARADCSRRKCGAVIVRRNRIVATGYNGAPAGDSGCLEGACPRAKADVPPGSSYDTGKGACIALHAEQNAVLYSARDDVEGGTIYVTSEPCGGCRRMIRGSGLQRIIWAEEIWTGTKYSQLKHVELVR